MAPIPPTPKYSLGHVVVIGGCGFLGHHIVNLLLSSTTSTVSVIDLFTTRNRRPESDGVGYHTCDITDTAALTSLFTTLKPDVVIHTASPNLIGANNALYHKVNVVGTQSVIAACQSARVKALVYTSSASVISDTQSDLINADERWPVIPASAQIEYYSTTKAEAEAAVLAANREQNLLTTSIRPAGIFGPGDVQLLPPIMSLVGQGKTGFQLGDNTNLFDFTYVVNVAYAHLLAARALLATAKLSTTPLDHERVDGEAFFITNDSPIPFWDFARMVFKATGSDKGTEHVWVISKDVGLVLGGFLEWVMWAVGRPSKLTRRQVRYSCMTRYYDIGKAKKRLGYAPIVGLEEGVVLGVQALLAQEKELSEKKSQ